MHLSCNLESPVQTNRTHWTRLVNPDKVTQQIKKYIFYGLIPKDLIYAVGGGEWGQTEDPVGKGACCQPWLSALLSRPTARMVFPPTFTRNLWFLNKCIGFIFFKGKCVKAYNLSNNTNRFHLFTHSLMQERRMWTLHTDYTVTPRKEEEESKTTGVTKEDSDFIPHGTRRTMTKYTPNNKRQRHVELRTWSWVPATSQHPFWSFCPSVPIFANWRAHDKGQVPYNFGMIALVTFQPTN